MLRMNLSYPNEWNLLRFLISATDPKPLVHIAMPDTGDVRGQENTQSKQLREQKSYATYRPSTTRRGGMPSNDLGHLHCRISHPPPPSTSNLKAAFCFSTMTTPKYLPTYHPENKAQSGPKRNLERTKQDEFLSGIHSKNITLA